MSRFLTAKVAMATLTTVVAVGGVATAATVVRTASHNDNAKVVRDVGKAGTDRGPDAVGSAAAGLCRAWAAGNGRDNGGMEDSAAFQALIDAAGGEDKVPAFCAAADGSATTASNAGTAGGEGNGQGPAATEAGRGLCKSWAAGEPNETSKAKLQRMGSPAFEALVEAAGGEANIPAFCAATSTTESQEDSTTPGRSGDHGPPAETDRGSPGVDQGRSTSNG